MPNINKENQQGKKGFQSVSSSKKGTQAQLASQKGSKSQSSKSSLKGSSSIRGK